MAGTGGLSGLARSVLERAEPHLPRQPLVVALSGGADSAVCAWAASQARAEVRAVFVDHGFPESRFLGEAARSIADHLGLGLAVREVKIREGASEGNARQARYQALQAELRPEEILLTGHTADDQAETVLANLLRGAGPGGLSGIPRRRDQIARPLLDVWRAETRQLATRLGLPWRDDPSNLEVGARRNLIRRRVLPDLESRFNPRLREALHRTASLLAEDEALLAAQLGDPIRLGEPDVRLPAPLLATLPAPLAARAVREALRAVRGPHAGTSDDVEAILQVARGEAQGAVIGGRVEVERAGPWVIIGASPVPPGEERTLAVPGRTVFGPVVIEAWFEPEPPAAWPLSAWVEIWDEEALAGARLRPAGRGGRIALATGSKEVADALAEAGVPGRLRAAWPVVETDEGVAWLPGVRRAPFGWVGPGTTRYLWLSAGTEGMGDP